jgi:phospho-N-acetylmuramoyl-pentapeptide-transferase
MSGIKLVFYPTTPELIWTLWISFFVGALLAYPIWRLLIRLKSQQNVSVHLESHQVKQGTPTMGGIVIACGAIAGFIFQATRQPIVSIEDPAVHRGPNFGLIALVLFVGFAFIGFADDFIAPRFLGKKRGLAWKEKILLQFAFAAIGSLMASGGRIDLFAGLTFFLILAFSNAFNFLDGLDGLAGSVLLSLAGGFAGLAWLTESNAQFTMLMIPLIAATIPFLYLNAPPAKVFMGDVGSLPIGAVLGLTASALLWSPSEARPYFPHGGGRIASWPVVDFNGWTFNWTMLGCLALLSVVMIAELVPVPLQIFWVKFTKRREVAKGLSLDASKDYRLFKFKTPIHHAFEELPGWKETRVTAVFALTQLLLSLAAVSLYYALNEKGIRHWHF